MADIRYLGNSPTTYKRENKTAIPCEKCKKNLDKYRKLNKQPDPFLIEHGDCFIGLTDQEADAVMNIGPAGRWEVIEKKEIESNEKVTT